MVRDDIIPARVINDMEVSCPNMCPWKGKASQHDDHVRKCPLKKKPEPVPEEREIEEEETLPSWNFFQFPMPRMPTEPTHQFLPPTIFPSPFSLNTTVQPMLYSYVVNSLYELPRSLPISIS
jgi:hypothetical protein